MTSGDWIGTALTVFGFGFSLWAFMLKKAIETLSKINDNLILIDKRVAALEHWREFRDVEFLRLHKMLAVAQAEE